MHQAVGISVQSLVLHQRHVFCRNFLIRLDIAALQDGAGRGRQACVGTVASRGMVRMSGLLKLGMGPSEGWRTAPAVGEAWAGWRARGCRARRGGEGVEAASWRGVARGVHHLPLKRTRRDVGYHGDLQMRALCFPCVSLTWWRLTQTACHRSASQRRIFSKDQLFVTFQNLQVVTKNFLCCWLFHFFFLIRPMAEWKKWTMSGQNRKIL